MLSATCRDNLKALTQAYAKANGQKVSVVSRRIYGTSGFLEDFFSGARSMSVDKYDEILGVMLGSWPKEAQWPRLRPIVIHRPSTRK